MHVSQTIREINHAEAGSDIGAVAEWYNLHNIVAMKGQQ